MTSDIVDCISGAKENARNTVPFVVHMGRIASVQSVIGRMRRDAMRLRGFPSRSVKYRARDEHETSDLHPYSAGFVALTLSVRAMREFPTLRSGMKRAFFVGHDGSSDSRQAVSCASHCSASERSRLSQSSGPSALRYGEPRTHAADGRLG